MQVVCVFLIRAFGISFRRRRHVTCLTACDMSRVVGKRWTADAEDRYLLTLDEAICFVIIGRCGIMYLGWQFITTGQVIPACRFGGGYGIHVVLYESLLCSFTAE